MGTDLKSLPEWQEWERDPHKHHGIYHVVNEHTTAALIRKLANLLEQAEAELAAYRSDQRDDYSEDKRELERKYTEQMKRAEKAEADTKKWKARQRVTEQKLEYEEKLRGIARAELAELKARRCEGCKHQMNCYIGSDLVRDGAWVGRNVNCNRYERREE